jgi:hypothetical protein
MFLSRKKMRKKYEDEKATSLEKHQTCFSDLFWALHGCNNSVRLNCGWLRIIICITVLFLWQVTEISRFFELVNGDLSCGSNGHQPNWHSTTSESFTQEAVTVTCRFKIGRECKRACIQADLGVAAAKSLTVVKCTKWTCLFLNRQQSS